MTKTAIVFLAVLAISGGCDHDQNLGANRDLASGADADHSNEPADADSYHETEDMASCTPKSCSQLGAACGPIIDNCGVSRSCGGCGGDSVCSSNNQCIPHCGDGTKNVDEGDIDCGGAACSRCNLGQSCNATSDCVQGTCDNNVCRAGTFTLLSPMPTQRHRAAMATGSDGKIYVLGGISSSSALTTVEVYTPSSDSWSSMPAMGTARAIFAAAFGSDGRLYAVGGQLGNNWAEGSSRSGEAYDFGTHQWSAIPQLSVSRAGGRLVAANGSLYMIGGIKAQSYSYVDQGTLEILPAGGSAWQASTTTLLGARDSFATTLLSSGHVLVAGGYRWVDNPAYSAGCTGYCPPKQLNNSLATVEECDLLGGCTALGQFPNNSYTDSDWEVGAAQIDDTAVYLFGNVQRSQQFDQGTSMSWKFDVTNKSWTQLAGTPDVVNVNGATVSGGKIYVLTSEDLYLFTP